MPRGRKRDLVAKVAPSGARLIFCSTQFTSLTASAMLIPSIALAVLAAATVHSHRPESDRLIKEVPALPIGLYRHLRAAEARQADQDRPYSSSSYDSGHQIPFSSASSSTKFAPHEFDQLVSHDPNVPGPFARDASSGQVVPATFKQRYWFDASFYREGGPVYLLDAGETNAEGRLPFLESGILKILSEATGGIGIVFEHRYCESLSLSLFLRDLTSGFGFVSSQMESRSR